MQNTLEFLKQLKENNNRDWFAENRNLYDEARHEFNNFTATLIAKTAAIDPSIGSLLPKDCVFRIFRDVRFSKDKTPYKPNFGAFMVAGGRNSGKAGYYLHIEAGGSFVGGGIYMPPAENLKKVRSLIFGSAEEYKEITTKPDFINTFGQVQGEKLKNAPRGFSPDFEDVDLLKYKSHFVSCLIDDKQIYNASFIDDVIDRFKVMLPFNQYINSAFGEECFFS